jgi:hypothetical protein
MRVFTDVVGGDPVNLKKISLLVVLGVAVMLASVATPTANAQVAIMVSVGSPVYVHPRRPYRYSYAVPYVAVLPYVRVYPRVYVGPVYYRHSYPRGFYERRDFGYRR